ncbi:MAG: hypothetical protein CML13_17450 [Puniceicoccaceae bacterium]|nr:hypothetical protein [Puniceicoccaceae bacterium]
MKGHKEEQKRTKKQTTQSERKSPKWEKTGTQYLIRNAASGIFYARFRQLGKIKFRTLETTSISVARYRLREIIGQVDELRKNQSAVSLGIPTLSQCIERARGRVAADGHLKERSKEAWEGSFRKLEKTWPGALDIPVDRAARMVSDWFTSFQANGTEFKVPGTKTTRKGASISSCNKAIAGARRIFEIAVESGALARNPVDDMRGRKYRSPQQKEVDMPDKEDFLNMVQRARGYADGKGRQQSAAELIEGLAYTGMRLGEAAALVWGDVNEKREVIRIREGKTKAARRNIPIIPPMSDLLARMRARREKLGEGLGVDDLVFAVSEAQKTLTRACGEANIGRLTHHDLRHFFATVCIQSGVDIPTVARWMGHADGGALAMRIYGHLRDEHSTKMAKGVKL